MLQKYCRYCPQSLEQRHQTGTLTAGEEQQLLALLARVRGLHLKKLTNLRQVVPDFTGVEVVNANNAVLGEFDGINMAEGMFIEDKSADGLNMVNPRTGPPAQTPADWARKHVFASMYLPKQQSESMASNKQPKPAPLELVLQLFRLSKTFEIFGGCIFA